MTDQQAAQTDTGALIARRHADKWRKRAQKHHRADGRRSDYEQDDLERAKICDAIADDIERAAKPGPCPHGVRWPWACDDCDQAALRATTPATAGAREERYDHPFSAPEIEEDEDGTVTIRSFWKDGRSCVSFVVYPDYVLQVETSLDGNGPSSTKRLERNFTVPPVQPAGGDDYPAHEALTHLVGLIDEEEALHGGGPNWRARYDAALSEAREIVRVEP